jgi:hypothetical protein
MMNHASGMHVLCFSHVLRAFPGAFNLSAAEVSQDPNLSFNAEPAQATPQLRLHFWLTNYSAMNTNRDTRQGGEYQAASFVEICCFD